ncbi:MAG: hypothetical protein HYY78_22095 [Betaproteobacteria bacterium]|nr:hypothetical protein [Betaproteobacteria bacterium]
MSDAIARFISVKANLLQQVKCAAYCAAHGRNQNAMRTRQALRGIKDMFKKDGTLMSAECKVPSAECGMQGAICEALTQNSELRTQHLSRERP